MSNSTSSTEGMSQAQNTHTPAPWVVVFSENNDRCEVEGGHGLIARCHNPFPFDTTWDERDANARLIAAAPQLLEALKMAKSLLEIEGYEAGGASMQVIDAAITLATKR